MRKIDLDAFFQLAKDVAPFLLPGFGLVGPQHFSEIPLAKERAPFHAAQGLLHPPGFGVDPMRRIHQGIARHGRLAKDRAPHLIRRNEPSTGTLPSNAILRFQKASYTYHFSQSKDVPYALRGSFIAVSYTHLTLPTNREV